MILNEKTAITLEFDKIREMLASMAMTEGAKSMARMLEPSDDIDIIKRNQRRTFDARRLIDSKGHPSFGYVKDVSDACERADKGAVLSPRELLDIGGVLKTSRILIDYLKGNKLYDTVLDELFDRLMPRRTLEEKIFRSIMSEDMIADEASRELADIRRKIRLTNLKIKETLQKYIGASSYSKYLQENIVTTRNGRYVVPVKAECKNEIKGLVHDTSASGATIFVEPMAVVEANNELRVLESKEEHEIERILADLSAEASQSSDAVMLNYRNITEIAFVFACGDLAEKLKCSMPEITEKRQLDLIRARHPLISKEKVVPVSIAIGKGKGYDTLIITGPNTGGKTVTLKTIGLFAIMAQSGLQIPADEGSEICIFSNILVDLGDEQSIEQSLSTFSSHMVKIVSIVGSADDRSLVLFDELGAGTDPIEGAALARSIIEYVRKCGSICVATTHYAELKAYALDTDGVMNASCEFNVETLKPTYRLIIGTPGKSNAFAISQKLGLCDEIIQSAEKSLSKENRQFEDVIAQLERSRIEADKNREEAIALREELEKYKAKSERDIKQKLAEADRELERSKAKAVSILESAKAASAYILDQMDKLKKQKDSNRLGDEITAARKAVREYLKEHEDEVNPVDEPDYENEEYVLPRPLRRGDEVEIRTIGKKGVVIELPDKNNNVQVQAGILKTRVSLNDIRLIEDKPSVISNGKKIAASSYKVERSNTFKSEIDLRGLTGDEAWLKVDKYIDDAVMYGMSTVTLVHGKGTGALKNALWAYLKGDKRIKSFRIGKYGEGDGGVTVLELK